MGCTSSSAKAPTIALEIEKSVEPHSEEERQVFEMVAPVMERSPKVLNALIEYTGCEDPIRKALGDPSPENDKIAWNAVRKNVDILYQFYAHSQELEHIFPKLLVALCDGDAQHNIASNQALVKQFAEVLSFGFRFDESKMVKPAIQNDFSYYRRVLTRMRAAQRMGTKKPIEDEEEKEEDHIKVDEELANKISLFFAYPTPMMKVLIDTTTSYESGKYNDTFSNGLAMIANLCYSKINDSPNMDKESQLLLLCAMTGAIILTDHLLHPQGAFHKKSPIMIKNCIQCLKNGVQQPTDFLLNSIRFTTIHLNEPQSMPIIQRLLA